MKNKLKFPLMLILATTLLLTSCASNFEAKLNKGSDLILEGKLDEAKEIFLKLMEKHDDESQLYLKLADIFIKEEDFNLAINILNKGLEKTEDKDNISLKLGQVYLSISDLYNAEEYLMKVKGESSELANSLIKLAGDSNDETLLDKTFDEYKDKDIIKENHEFFQNSLLAYSKFKKSERIEESVNKALELNLKLDPIVIMASYNTLLDLQMKDLANSIIEKDIYNKEIGDLSIIHEIIEEDNNKEFINLTSGYFTTSDRLDIALLYGIKDEGYYSKLEVVLVNGLTGKIISSLEEETINAYMHIDTFDTTGHSNHVLSIWGHAGGSGTPGHISLYRFNGTSFEKIDYKQEADSEIVFKDNFEFEIKSESLDINYLLQLDLENVPYYISEGFYNNEGDFLVSQDEFGSGYEHMDQVHNLAREDHILYSLELWDTYDNKSYLGAVNTYFKLQGDKLVLVDLVVEDGQGNLKKTNYKEEDGYMGVDISDYIPRKDELKDVLSFHFDLFKETENTIKSKFGTPIEEDYYGVKYLKYDDFIAFMNPMDPDELVSSIWTNDLLGMENNKEFIIQKFGDPEDSGYDEDELESYMGYSLDNYWIGFIDIGENHPYIEIKKQ